VLESVYSQRYANHDARDAIWKVLAERFYQTFVDPQDTVLDVACGYGWFINHIRCKAKFAVDINPDARKFLSHDVKFLQGPSTRIELPDHSIDKIYVGNLLEHLQRAEIVSTVQEFFRVLRPGGAVLVLQPNIRFLQKDFWMFFDHITPIDDRAVDEVFAMCGFRLEHKILKFLPHSNSNNRLSFMKPLVRLYLALPFVWPLFGKSSFMIYRRLDHAAAAPSPTAQ
jgi:ubiquinone/menaquinone biosynthesis C-methylase UbiE